MKKVLYQMGKVLLFLLPLVLGMIGLWVLGEVPLLDALFSCINMYVLNYGDTPENVFVELARWLAPITTVSGIVLALRSIRDQVRCLVRYCLGDGVAVYGPVESRDLLVARLGRHGIQGGRQAPACPPIHPSGALPCGRAGSITTVSPNHMPASWRKMRSSSSPCSNK